VSRAKEELTPIPLKKELTPIPLAERVDPAEALWQSIGEGLQAGEERQALSHARRRDDEPASDSVSGRTHDEVMKAARRAVGCDWLTIRKPRRN
jgi:hypothetical protein